jgi:hypothetical protein
MSSTMASFVRERNGFISMLLQAAALIGHPHPHPQSQILQPVASIYFKTLRRPPLQHQVSINTLYQSICKGGKEGGECVCGGDLGS